MNKADQTTDNDGGERQQPATLDEVIAELNRQVDLSQTVFERTNRAQHFDLGYALGHRHAAQMALALVQQFAHLERRRGDAERTRRAERVGRIIAGEVDGTEEWGEGGKEDGQ
jgi:hypothetical protein